MPPPRREATRPPEDMPAVLARFLDGPKGRVVALGGALFLLLFFGVIAGTLLVMGPTSQGSPVLATPFVQGGSAFQSGDPAVDPLQAASGPSPASAGLGSLRYINGNWASGARPATREPRPAEPGVAGDDGGRPDEDQARRERRPEAEDVARGEDVREKPFRPDAKLQPLPPLGDQRGAAWTAGGAPAAPARAAAPAAAAPGAVIRTQTRLAPVPDSRDREIEDAVKREFETAEIPIRTTADPTAVLPSIRGEHNFELFSGKGPHEYQDPNKKASGGNAITPRE